MTKYATHFGFKHAALDSDTNQSNVIARASAILGPATGPGGYGHITTELVYQPATVVSGTLIPAHVVPTNATTTQRNVLNSLDPNGDYWGTYDSMVTNLGAAAHPLSWIVSLHTVAVDVSGNAHAPNKMSGYNSIFTPIGQGTYQSAASDFADFAAIAARVVARYGYYDNVITLGASNIGSYAYNGGGTNLAPGWVGLRGMEVWNEPNTGTGNMGGLMTPYITAHLLSYSAGAIKNAGLSHVLGPAVGTIDLNYIQQLFNVKPDWPSQVSHITCHVYPGSQDPTLAASAAQPRRPKNLTLLQALMTKYGYSEKSVAMSEGGYPATFTDSTYPPNINSQAQASTYETEMIQYLRDTLNLDFYTHYQVIDDDTQLAGAGSGTWGTWPTTPPPPNQDPGWTVSPTKVPSLVSGSPNAHEIGAAYPFTDPYPFGPSYYKEKLGLTNSAGTSSKTFAAQYTSLVAGTI